MHHRVALLHPLLIAGVPALSLAAENPGQYRFTDLLTVLGVVVLGAGLALAAATFVLRRWERSARAEQLAAMLVTVAVFWFFYYLGISRTLQRTPWLAPPRGALPLVLLASVAAVALLARRPAALAAVNRVVAIAGAILVGMLGVRVAGHQLLAARAVAGSQLVRSLAAPVPVGAVPAGRNDPRRDIYLVVLDTRINSAVLRERFGASDAPFEDSLRALGFTIPRDMQSNYAQSVVSLASILNFEHVTRLAVDVGPDSRDYSLPRHLVAHNRAARFLKGQGYKYVFFPSSWYSLTERSPTADEQFEARTELDLVDELRRTEFRRRLVRSTMLMKSPRARAANYAEPTHYFRSFDGLARLAEDTAPTFAFAHFLLPHAPFLVDEECRPSARPLLTGLELDTPEVRAGYLAQLRCTNRLVLDFATTVLRRSPTPPIILIVGDHGTQLTDPGFWARPDRVSAEFVRERFGAFGAFYAPDGGDTLFAGRVTLVNVLRQVLRHYFGAALPLASDAQFISGDLLYRFYRRDRLRLVERPGAARAAAAQAAPPSSGRAND